MRRGVQSLDMIEYHMSMSKRSIKQTSQSILLSGQRIFYRTAGTGSPLVLLHGHGVSGAIWQRVLPFLAQHYQVIAVDLPGYGRSHFTGEWRLHKIAALLVNWLQQTQLPPVALIGHSMGGAV